jgi:hypothetical protein
MPLIRVDEETKLALESYRLKLAYDTQWGGGNSMTSALRALLGLNHGIERKVRLTTAGTLVNHPYHIRMEQFARQISIPSPSDSSPGAKWFYQRRRSQYLDEKARIPRSEQLRFELEYPKRQVFSATDLAKFLNVWCGKPHVVSRGAWKNLDDFASSVDIAWEQSGYQFNEAYYRQAIAKAIIYRTVEKLVSHQTWLQTGSRSQVVAYAIAKLSFDLDEANTPINFETIWGSQRISDALAEALTVAAKAAYTVISNVCGTNVGEWAKQQDCWARVSSLKIDYPKTLKEDLLTKAGQLKEDGRSDFHVSSVNLTRTGKMPTTSSSPEELGVELAHQEETQGADLGYIGRFGGGFKTAMAVGRPESSDEVIQNLLDGLFSGALDRGIDLQLSRDGSGRWISFPDNFMSILLQSRNKALLVTVYGKPESFDDLGHTLRVKADRPPYSRFHIRSTQDLPTALDIIETSLKLRSEKLHGNTPRFEPMRAIDVQPSRLTSSFLAIPAGMDVTSLIGQQIRSQGANRCLVVVANNAVAEEMRARLFRRFSLLFRVSDNVGDVRGSRFLPAEPPKSLFMSTHALFKEVKSSDFSQSQRETFWDMVALDGIQELLKDKPWWDTAGRDLLVSQEFTQHLSIIGSSAIFKQSETLEAIHDQRDTMPGKKPPANRAEALDFLVRMNLEPFWDGSRPLFRKIAGTRGYNVTRQSREQIWPKLIELLELDTKVDADQIRKEVKGRLGI